MLTLTRWQQNSWYLLSAFDISSANANAMRWLATMSSLLVVCSSNGFCFVFCPGDWSLRPHSKMSASVWHVKCMYAWFHYMSDTRLLHAAMPGLHCQQQRTGT